MEIGRDQLHLRRIGPGEGSVEVRLDTSIDEAA
jgi:hypothetical protein